MLQKHKWHSFFLECSVFGIYIVLQGKMYSSAMILITNILAMSHKSTLQCFEMVW